MAATSRGAAASLKESLTRRGHDFSFFQAMRLLRILTDESEPRRQGRVRVRPELNLAFPPSDVAAIEETCDGYLMTVTFLGLYGQSSPLPTFYTEQLLDESAAEIPAAREFLDIINHRFYTLFFESVRKYHLFAEVDFQQDHGRLLMLCLLGLHGQNAAVDGVSRGTWLPFAGLLSMGTRSAAGLSALLTDALQVPVKVIQCQVREVQIPPEQRLQMGSRSCTIGDDAVLGSRMPTLSGMFRVQLGPLDQHTFAAYLPGTSGREFLDSLIGTYLKQPLAWDVELRLRATEAPSAVLGTSAPSRLGCDSWMKPCPEDNLSATFPGNHTR